MTQSYIIETVPLVEKYIYNLSISGNGTPNWTLCDCDINMVEGQTCSICGYTCIAPKEIASKIRIVKAAVRYKDVVYTGWRHFQIMNWMKETGHPKVSSDDQGFLDNDGHFLPRYDSGIIAYYNGQTKTLINPLTSEDLWTVNGEPIN